MYRCFTSKRSSGQTLIPSSTTNHVNARYSLVVGSTNKLESESSLTISNSSSSLSSRVNSPSQRMVTLGARLAVGTSDGEAVGNLLNEGSDDSVGKEDGYSLGTSVGPVVGISDG
jgi:hypothetical protein